MITGEVAGTVVCTVKSSGLSGIPLLVVRLIESGKKAGLVVAADATRQAGLGDFVFLITSKEASAILRKPYVPADCAIVGFIDRYNEEIQEDWP
ncbi:MAG: ethanolamine utilization protein EutN [Defluviitaleaceae bacterium]|nr:ethanolamine utilization protein EutN [Defluviitaleaceae bacterium]